MRQYPFVLVLLIFNIAQAQQLVWGPVQSLGNSGQDALRPRIEADLSGPMILWGSPPSDLYFSKDIGGGFIAPAIITPSGVQPWATSWAGGDLTSFGDTVVAVYSTGSQGVGTLYASRSTDGGVTWPDTTRIAPAPGLEARFPTVVYVPGQGPVVQYMEFDPNWQDPRYVVCTSLDGGDTYGQPIPVSAPFAPGEVCDCCTGQVISSGTDVVALFRNNDSNVRTMWGSVSVDGGLNFPIGSELDQTGWISNTCSSSGPDGYIAGDSIRYVWMSGAANGLKAYRGSAALSDLTIASNALVNPGQSSSQLQNFPRIAGSGDTLGIVWEQWQSGQREILFRWSTNGWAGLSAPDTVNIDLAGAQRNPDIAFANGVFHIVWEEQVTGTLGYRSAELDANTSINGISTARTIKVWPNPTNGLLQVIVPAGCGTLVLTDAVGKEMIRSRCTSVLDLSSVGTGVYSLQFIDAKGNLITRTRVVKESLVSR